MIPRRLVFGVALFVLLHLLFIVDRTEALTVTCAEFKTGDVFFDDFGTDSNMDNCMGMTKDVTVALGCSSTVNFTLTNTVLDYHLKVLVGLSQWWGGGHSCGTDPASSGNPTILLVGNTFKKGVTIALDTGSSTAKEPFFADIVAQGNIFYKHNDQVQTDTDRFVDISGSDCNNIARPVNFTMSFTKNIFWYEHTNAGSIAVTSIRGFEKLTDSVFAFVNNNFTSVHSQYDSGLTSSSTLISVGSSHGSDKDLILLGNVTLNVTDNYMRIASEPFGGTFLASYFNRVQFFGEDNVVDLVGNEVIFHTDANYDSQFSSKDVLLATNALLVADPVQFNVLRNNISFIGTGLRMTSVVRMHNDDSSAPGVGYNGAHFNIIANTLTIRGNRSDAFNMGFLFDQYFQLGFGSTESHDFQLNISANEISVDLHLGHEHLVSGKAYLVHLGLPATRHTLHIVENRFLATAFNTTFFAAVSVDPTVSLQNGSSVFIADNNVTVVDQQNYDGRFKFFDIGEEIHVNSALPNAGSIAETTITLARNIFIVDSIVKAFLLVDATNDVNVGLVIGASTRINLIDNRAEVQQNRHARFVHVKVTQNTGELSLQVEHNTFILHNGGGGFVAYVPAVFKSLSVRHNTFHAMNATESYTSSLVDFKAFTGSEPGTIRHATYVIENNTHQCNDTVGKEACSALVFGKKADTLRNSTLQFSSNTIRYAGGGCGGITVLANLTLEDGSAIELSGNSIEITGMGDAARKPVALLDIASGNLTFSPGTSLLFDANEATVQGSSPDSSPAVEHSPSLNDTSAVVVDNLFSNGGNLTFHNNTINMENLGNVDASVFKVATGMTLQDGALLEFSSNPLLRVASLSNQMTSVRIFDLSHGTISIDSSSTFSIAKNGLELVSSDQRTSINTFIVLDFNELLMQSDAQLLIDANTVEMVNVTNVTRAAAVTLPLKIFNDSVVEIVGNTFQAGILVSAGNGNSFRLISSHGVEWTPSNSSILVEENRFNVTSKASAAILKIEATGAGEFNVSFLNNEVHMTQTKDLPTEIEPSMEVSKNKGSVLDCETTFAPGSVFNASGNTIVMVNDLPKMSLIGIEVRLSSNRTTVMVNDGTHQDDVTTFYIRNNNVSLTGTLPHEGSVPSRILLPIIAMRPGDGSGSSDHPIQLRILNNEVASNAFGGGFVYASGIVVTTATDGDAVFPVMHPWSVVDISGNTVNANWTGLLKNVSAITQFDATFTDGCKLRMSENTVAITASAFAPEAWASGIVFSSTLFTRFSTSTAQYFKCDGNNISVTSDSPNGTAFGMHGEANRFLNATGISVGNNYVVVKAMSTATAFYSRAEEYVGVPAVEVFANHFNANAAAGTGRGVLISNLKATNTTIEIKEQEKLVAATSGVNPNTYVFNDEVAMAVALEFNNLQLTTETTLKFIHNSQIIAYPAVNTGIGIGVRVQGVELTGKSELWFSENAIQVVDRSSVDFAPTWSWSEKIYPGGMSLNDINVDIDSVLHVMHSNVTVHQPDDAVAKELTGVALRNVQFEGGYNFIKDMRVVLDIEGGVTDICMGLYALQVPASTLAQYGTVAVQENYIIMNYNRSSESPDTGVMSMLFRNFGASFSVDNNTIGVRTQSFVNRATAILFFDKLDRSVRASHNIIWIDVRANYSQATAHEQTVTPLVACVAAIIETANDASLTLLYNNCTLQVSEGEAVLSFLQLTGNTASSTASLTGENALPNGFDPSIAPVALQLQYNIAVFSSVDTPASAALVNATPFDASTSSTKPLFSSVAVKVDSNLAFPTGKISRFAFFDLRGAASNMIEKTALFLSGGHAYIGGDINPAEIQLLPVVQPFAPTSLHAVLQCSSLLNNSVMITNLVGATQQDNLYCWTNTTSQSQSLSPSRSLSVPESPTASASLLPTPSDTTSVPPTTSPTLLPTPSSSFTSTPSVTLTPSESVSGTLSMPPTLSASFTPTPSLSESVSHPSRSISLSQSPDYCDLSTTPRFGSSNDLLEAVTVSSLPPDEVPTPGRLASDGVREYRISIPGQRVLDSDGEELQIQLDFKQPLRNFMGRIIPSSGIPAINSSSSEMRVDVHNITKLTSVGFALQFKGDSTFFRREQETTIIIDRNSFVCPTRFDFIFVATFEKLPPEIPEDVVEAVQISTTVAVTAAGIVGSPTQIMQQTKLGALMSLTYCAFDHREQLSVMTNPLRFSFGPSYGAHYRGAVVGGFMLLVGTIIFVAIFGGVVYGFRKNRMSNKELQENTEITRIRRTFAFLHLPGVLIVPFVLVTQGISAASTSLFLHPYDERDPIIGVFGLVLVWGPTIFCLLLTRCWFRCEIMPRHENDNAKLLKMYGKWINYWFNTEKKWVDHSADGTFKKHYLHIFQDYQYAHYIVIEIALTNFVGILEGIRIADKDTCTAVMSLMLTVFFFLLAMGLKIRPCLDRFNGSFMHLMNGAGFLAAAFLVAGHTLDDDDLRAGEEWMSLAAMLLGTLKFFGDCVFIVIWLRGNKHIVSSMWKNFGDKKYDISEEEMNMLGETRQEAAELEQPMLKISALPENVTSTEDDLTRTVSEAAESFDIYQGPVGDAPDVGPAAAAEGTASPEPHDDLPPSHHIDIDDDDLFGDAANVKKSGGGGGLYGDDIAMDDDDGLFGGGGGGKKFYRTDEGQRFLDEIQRGLAVGTFDSGVFDPPAVEQPMRGNTIADDELELL